MVKSFTIIKNFVHLYFTIVKSPKKFRKNEEEMDERTLSHNIFIMSIVIGVIRYIFIMYIVISVIRYIFILFIVISVIRYIFILFIIIGVIVDMVSLCPIFHCHSFC